MAINVVQVATATAGSGSTTLTIPIACSGNSSFLVVGFGTQDYASAPSGATVNYAGIPMAQVTRQGETSGNQVATWMFYLVRPPSGSSNVVITLSQPRDFICGCAICLDGVDPVIPIGTFGANYSDIGVASLSTNVVSSTTGLCVDSFVTFDETKTIAAQAGQTERANLHAGTFPPNVYGISYGMSTKVGDISTTMGWDITPTAFPCAMIVLPLVVLKVFPPGGFNLGCGVI